jgi:hypothetical protein
LEHTTSIATQLKQMSQLQCFKLDEGVQKGLRWAPGWINGCRGQESLGGAGTGRVGARNPKWGQSAAASLAVSRLDLPTFATKTGDSVVPPQGLLRPRAGCRAGSIRERPGRTLSNADSAVVQRDSAHWPGSRPVASGYQARPLVTTWAFATKASL